jgi:nucleoside-diphosphate-sugar epimerase
VIVQKQSARVHDARPKANIARRHETVLVTGGAGYIGSLLVRRLLARGLQVCVLDALLYGDSALRDVLKHPNLALVRADLRRPDAMAHAFRQVDAVVHLGAIVGDPACDLDPYFTTQINVDGTRAIAALCKSNGVRRLIFASTCSVYGASDDILDEGSALNPVSLYAKSKIASEQLLLSGHDDAFAPVILRFATAYGHSPRPRFDLVVNLLTAKAVAGDPITIHGGEQWRPFVHADDIARAVILALDAPLQTVAGQVFNVGSNDQNHQLSDIGVTIKELIPDADITTSLLSVDRRNYRVRFDKIRAALGFRPIHQLRPSISTLRAALDSGSIGPYHDDYYNNYQFLRAAMLDNHWLAAHNPAIDMDMMDDVLTDDIGATPTVSIA